MTDQRNAEATAKATDPIAECMQCDGDGSYHDASGTRTIRCQKCNGTGQHQVYDSKHVTSCNTCDGTALVPDTIIEGDMEECPTCFGSGYPIDDSM